MHEKNKQIVHEKIIIKSSIPLIPDSCLQRPSAPAARPLSGTLSDLTFDLDLRANMSRGGGDECRVYVGNLPPDIRSRDVDDLFHKYGKIVFVDLKDRRGPPFAFVEFEDPRDAEDAVRARDGYDYDGYKIRVEFPRGGGGSFRDGRGGGGAPRGRGPPARRSQFRVQVSHQEEGEEHLKIA